MDPEPRIEDEIPSQNEDDQNEQPEESSQIPDIKIIKTESSQNMAEEAKKAISES
jgi:hypothetical protein